MQSIETMLRTVPNFDQLDGDALQELAANGELDEAAPGDVLFREGGLPESLYVLLDGRVSLTGTTPDASTTVIDILGPASSFVLANVLTNQPYQMGAQVVAEFAAGADRGAADARDGDQASGGRHGHDARDVGGTGRHDTPGGRSEGARRGAAAGHLFAEPDDGPDSADGGIPTAGQQGSAGALARLPSRKPVTRVHRTAGVWRGDAWLASVAARRIKPAFLCGRTGSVANGSRCSAAAGGEGVR